MSEFRGYIMIVAAAMLWGISATAAKFLLNQNVSTLLIVQTRVSFSTILLGMGFALFRPGAMRTRARDLWKFALLGVVGVAGANFTYYYVIQATTVATGILIQYTAPLFVMLYTVALKEERFSFVKLAAAVMSVGGCFLAVGGYDATVMTMTREALLNGIGSIICFSFLTVYSRTLVTRFGTWTTTFYAIVFASAFWLFVQPPWVVATMPVSGATWSGLAALAVLSVLLPHTLFMGGLKHVVPSRAIIISTLEPVVAIGSAALVLGEYLRGVQIGGALLVLAAVILLNVRPEHRVHHPPEG